MRPCPPLSPVPEEEKAAATAYEVGDKVEVQRIPRYTYWYPATVVAVLAEQQCCVVQYDDAVSDTVDWLRIRSWPPAGVLPMEEDDGIDLPLRGRVRDRAASNSSKPGTQSSHIFHAGDGMEQLWWHDDYGERWCPETVESAFDPRNCTYVVQRKFSECLIGGKMKRLEKIRPAVVEIDDDGLLDLCPGAKVEVRCDGAWAIGVVLGTVARLQYKVAIGKKITMIKERGDLRPRYKWDWSTTQWSIVTSSKSASVKRLRSPAEKASDDCERTYDLESFTIKKSRKERQQLDVIPDGSEHTLVSNMDNVSRNTSCIVSGVSGNTGTYEEGKTGREKLKFGIKRHEEQCNPHSSLDATTMQLSTKGKHDSLLDKGLTATIDSSCEANQNEHQVATYIPFVKNFPAWSTFEEMEVFKKMPQQPHFGPLEKEWPVRREGIALGLMGSFANVVESIRKSSIEDSDESFEENSCILSQLKDNGFSVDKLQTCLNELIEMKSKYAKHIKEKDMVQAQKQLKGDVCSKVNSLRAEKMKAVVEHEKMLGQLCQQLHQLDEVKKRGEVEFSELEEAESMVQKACYDIKEQFAHTLADHLG